MLAAKQTVLTGLRNSVTRPRFLPEPMMDQAWQAGDHEYRLGSTDLPAGILFYRLNAGQEQVSGKVCLAK